MTDQTYLQCLVPGACLIMPDQRAVVRRVVKYPTVRPSHCPTLRLNPTYLRRATVPVTDHDSDCFRDVDVTL